MLVVVGGVELDGVVDVLVVDGVVGVVVSVVRSVVVITDGTAELLVAGVVLGTTGVSGPELRWISATTPTITPAVTARISRVIANVRPAARFRLFRWRWRNHGDRLRQGGRRGPARR